MSKRASLVEDLAARAERIKEETAARAEAPAAPAPKLEADSQGAAEPAKKKPVKPSGVVLSVHLPGRTLQLLQRLAGARRIKAGTGKASVSALLVELVEAKRQELEAEVERLEAEIG